jgi:putative redox protein
MATEVVVTSLRNLQQEITIGPHRLVADEPVAGGGDGTGPDPELLVGGALAADQETRLREIAAKCPVHRTLTSEVVIVSR